MAEPVLSIEVQVTAWKRDFIAGSVTLSSPRWVTYAEPLRVELLLADVHPELLTRLADDTQRWRVTLAPVEGAADAR